MSTFPVPDYLAENAARFEKMSKDFGATLPKDMAVAINLMSQPGAGVAALTALGFGVAGQAFGLWAGAVIGAAEASQRLFTPLAPTVDRAAVPPAAPAVTRPKPVLKVVAKAVPAGKPVAAPAVEAVPAAARTEPAPPVVVKAEPAARRVVAKAEPAKKPVAAPAVEALPAAGKTDLPELMPEDFHKPRAIKRPAAPDDLKAISGIGPKLEKVLNDLGVWTYAQVAGWGQDEVAWVDDYLSFSGRIGRDKWIEQATKLAAASAKKPRKG